MYVLHKAASIDGSILLGDANLLTANEAKESGQEPMSAFSEKMFANLQKLRKR